MLHPFNANQNGCGIPQILTKMELLMIIILFYYRCKFKVKMRYKTKIRNFIKVLIIFYINKFRGTSNSIYLLLFFYFLRNTNLFLSKENS